MTGKELEKQKLQEAFKEKKIGLALSGGGYRAAVFHLGMLSYMAENELLEKVTHISTVSGGSIVMGLIYKLNGFKFPTSNEYLENVHEQAIEFLSQRILLDANAFFAALLGVAYNDKFPTHEMMVLKLKQEWLLDVDIQDIECDKIWTINTTTGETGKSWRISKEKMGDYTIGEIKKPNINLAEAIAASAGFPMAIGPLVLDLSQYRYTPKDKIQREYISLYDGGLYDNLGTEVFYGGNFSEFPKSIDFLIVSDASKPLSTLEDMYKMGRKNKLTQISDISTEQIRSLRSRMFRRLIEKKNEPNLGIRIRLGDSMDGFEEDVECAMGIETDLKPFSSRESKSLINSGFAAASANFSEYLSKVEEFENVKETDEAF